MSKMKTRIGSILAGALLVTGLGAMSTPASAYSVKGCQAPYTTWVNGYWKGVQQKCYVDYNRFEEIFANSRDGYKLAYSWTENTVSGAKYNFKTYNLKYA